MTGSEGLDRATCTSPPEYRFDAEQIIVWQAFDNGFPVVYVTTDPDLDVFVRPVCTSMWQGVELVDRDGRILTWSGLGYRP